MASHPLTPGVGKHQVSTSCPLGERWQQLLQRWLQLPVTAHKPQVSHVGRRQARSVFDRPCRMRIMQMLRVVRRGIPSSKLKLNLSVCTALREVDLEGCGITRLDVSGCTQLEKLNCSMNNISKLKFPHHPHLKELL